jgi:hypothetical protein
MRSLQRFISILSGMFYHLLITQNFELVIDTYLSYDLKLDALGHACCRLCRGRAVSGQCEKAVGMHVTGL